MTNRIEIAGDGDGEDCDFLVCMELTDPLLLPDNLIDLCCRCMQPIQHRPHVPKRPQKVCRKCIQPDTERQAAKGELNVMITPQTAEDLAEFIKKKRAN